MQHASNDCEEFLAIYGFGIAVHAGCQAALTVPLDGVSGKSDNGQVASTIRFLIPANKADSLQAIHHRHLQVKQDQIEALAFRDGYSVAAILTVTTVCPRFSSSRVANTRFT